MKQVFVSVAAEHIRRVCVRSIAAVVLFAPTAAVADGPAATPQRPSLSATDWTVPRGLFEFEVGAGFSEGFGGLPLFSKYGVTDALEIEAGINAVRWATVPTSTSIWSGRYIFLKTIA